MMETSTLLSASEWAQQTFGQVRLGHRRRRERAVTMAAGIAADPAASLPKQMGNEAALHAAYRFLQTPDVTYEQLIRTHVQQTREAMGKPERVLLIQDTTEVDYQPHPTTTGLGPRGLGTHHGFLVQSVLAILPDHRQVLGLAHQEPFLRQPAPKGETKRERDQRERESQVWERSVQAIGEPPAGVQWIHIGDRYSDMFPFLSLCQQMHCDFVVRAAQDRCVDLLVEQADTPAARRSHHQRRAQQHLFEVVRGWSAQGEQDLELDATKQSRARTAHLAISFGSLRLLPPEGHQDSSLRPLVVWVVRVWEPVGAVDLGAGPDGGARLGAGRLVPGALDRGGLSSRPQNRLSHRAAATAKLRGLAPFAGPAGTGGGAAAATADCGTRCAQAVGERGPAAGPGAGRGAVGQGARARRRVDRAAVLVHD